MLDVYEDLKEEWESYGNEYGCKEGSKENIESEKIFSPIRKVETDSSIKEEMNKIQQFLIEDKFELDNLQKKD